MSKHAIILLLSFSLICCLIGAIISPNVLNIGIILFDIVFIGYILLGERKK